MLRNQLIAALPPEDLAFLAPHIENVVLAQETGLYEPGEPVTHVYFPHNGMVSLLAALPSGAAIELATIGHEGVVGTMLIFGSRRSPNRANIQVACSASRVGIGHVVAALERSVAFRHAVTIYNESLLDQIQTTCACNALHDVEPRLARWILQTGDRIDSDDIALTQGFLSQMLGVQRTSVTLVARTLQTAGLIRYSRGHIRILDRPGLEDIACECYALIRRKIGPEAASDAR
jgi:CRP-like cAMP-binding protein